MKVVNEELAVDCSSQKCYLSLKSFFTFVFQPPVSPRRSLDVDVTVPGMSNTKYFTRYFYNMECLQISAYLMKLSFQKLKIFKVSKLHCGYNI